MYKLFVIDISVLEWKQMESILFWLQARQTSIQIHLLDRAHPHDTVRLDLAPQSKNYKWFEKITRSFS